MKRYLLPLLFCASQLQAQPVLVADIYPGTSGSKPYGLIDFNGKLAFTANDGTHSNGLWLAGAGSLHLLDYRTAPYDGYSFRPYKKCVLNNNLYYSAIAYQNDLELFRIDDRNNVQIIFDLPGPDQTYPANLCTANNDVYFSGNDGSYARKLWRYSPLYNITSLVVDIDPSFHTNGDIAQLTSINDILYFSSYYIEGGDSIPEAFRYDPSTKTLTRTGNISAKNHPEGFVQLNDQIYFINNTQNGKRLWSWDSIHQPIQISNLIDVNTLTIFQSKLYFEACYHTHAPNNLFSFDPLTNKTEQIPTTMGHNGIENSQMIAYNDKLFYCADGILWSYNGTDKPIPSFNPSTKLNGEELCISNNILYITGSADATGEELYAYYEAPAAVHALPLKYDVSIYPNPTTGSWTFNLTSLQESDLQLIVTDIAGRVISKQSITSNTISAAVPMPGNYVYYIADAQGNALQTGKLQKL